MITFGKRAGEYAAKSSKSLEQPILDESEIQSAIKQMLSPLENQNGENPGQIYDEMRDMMQQKVGIIRQKEELEEAIEELNSFKQRAMKSSSGTSRTYNSWLAPSFGFA